MNALPAFKTKVMPVVVIDDAEAAVPLAEALLAGGIDAIEITLRTPAGIVAIERVARAVPGMVVGAGTLTRPEHFRRVQDAGGVFAVSPGLTPALAQAARFTGLPLIPGTQTASEIIAAMEEGFGFVKLFPANLAGGITALKAYGSVFGEMKFCPTGGVTAETLADYLALANVPIVGGTWLTPPALVKAGDWAAITALAKAATQAAG
ncbi:bifunctional 4-hydroxy-2-oxoglutarate aldolase/2-dehydro-3-deoxy-phosphogluconate aldolase [Derxia lacustris]|uniref:bifunctional 4-hydroxy-2-oxoglutarate aldolase/2-dehydro-3-deoxy-phosphogluconate aldolase n=1 Tax=Derxia lacustris TaxID=764842 RepID=UPI000A16FF5D|nr:bifunctional 4-hydroxy-2-oxoglutarate aldolase/2-dehydro-3-deoxy-phosphogluconate aldolase [Derxia lacustris]